MRRFVAPGTLRYPRVPRPRQGEASRLRPLTAVSKIHGWVGEEGTVALNLTDSGSWRPGGSLKAASGYRCDYS